MIRLLIATLLTTAVATAQTAPKAGKPGSATSATAGVATTRTGGPASKSATKPDHPIPEQPLRTKLRNANSTNPNYNREKDRTDRGTKREFSPRRTASGARKDTMNQRRPGGPVQN